MQNLPLKKDYLWVRIACILWITCDKEFIVGKIYLICSKLTFSAFQYNFFWQGGTLNPTRHFCLETRQSMRMRQSFVSFFLSTPTIRCRIIIVMFFFVFLPVSFYLLFLVSQPFSSSYFNRSDEYEHYNMQRRLAMWRQTRGKLVWTFTSSFFLFTGIRWFYFS